MGRSISCAVLASLAAVGAVVPAHGDSAPIAPFEQLASQIASHIAGRPVTVQCDGDAQWTADESGFVSTQWNGATGQLLNLSTVAELAPAICAPLRQFAAAAVKPTKCLPRTTSLLGAAPPTARVRPAPVPCYLGRGRAAAVRLQSYWTAYASYAIAILTLAHESVHLSGVVGGTLPNGLAVGDPQAEAKADCFGMQWMPYVAEQLGDTSDDAQAVARYFWDKLYALSRATHPQYWSPDCRPGGALDARPPGAAAWP